VPLFPQLPQRAIVGIIVLKHQNNGPRGVYVLTVLEEGQDKTGGHEPYFLVGVGKEMRGGDGIGNTIVYGVKIKAGAGLDEGESGKIAYADVGRGDIDAEKNDVTLGYVLETRHAIPFGTLVRVNGVGGALVVRSDDGVDFFNFEARDIESLGEINLYLDVGKVRFLGFGIVRAICDGNVVFVSVVENDRLHAEIKGSNLFLVVLVIEEGRQCNGGSINIEKKVDETLSQIKIQAVGINFSDIDIG